MLMVSAIKYLCLTWHSAQATPGAMTVSVLTSQAENPNGVRTVFLRDEALPASVLKALLVYLYTGELPACMHSCSGADANHLTLLALTLLPLVWA